MGLSTQRPGVSVVRTDTPLMAFSPETVSSSKLSQSLKMKVGGALGMGKTEARATVSLEKTKFAPGEKIRVIIDMDNSDCKKEVKSFKTKL